MILATVTRRFNGAGINKKKHENIKSRYEMKHLEDDLQAACVKWFRYQYPNVVILHPKNEGNRKSVVMKANGKSYSPDGARNKKIGVLAGTPDLFVMKAKIEKLERYTTIWHGLWIELKVNNNKQTESQVEFMIAANIENYQYRVCRSFDEFQKTVNDYLI